MRRLGAELSRAECPAREGWGPEERRKRSSKRTLRDNAGGFSHVGKAEPVQYGEGLVAIGKKDGVGSLFDFRNKREVRGISFGYSEFPRPFFLVPSRPVPDFP